MKKKLIRYYSLLLTFSILFILADRLVAQTRYYVDQKKEASGDGKSWANAFKTLQEAIDETSTDVVDEIWVASGIYYPTRTPYGTKFDPPSRNHTFYISRDMKILGGFAGNESSLEQRDWEANNTILSGNRGNLEDSTDNFLHVVLAIGTENEPLTNNLVIDGFTITEGYANLQGTFGEVKGSIVYNYNGGGIYNIYASPTLSNLRIVKNVGFVGGGIFNIESSPIITNVIVSNNYSGSNGGGIYNLGSNSIITHANISNNIVNNIGGGGIYNASSNVTISHSTISNNKAPDGGGIYNSLSQVNLNDVIIESNNAGEGGGIFNLPEVKLYLTDVQIKNNVALYGGGLNNFRDSIFITGGSITGNKADFGGGMYTDGTFIEITKTMIAENEATFSHGGGLHAIKESTLIFKDAELKNNVARGNGGGLHLFDSSIATFIGGEISNNRAGTYGGGLYMNKSVNPLRQLSLNGVKVSLNTSSTGAGIYDQGSLSIYNNFQFISNSANNNGGGIYASTVSSPEFEHVTFEKNYATRGAGLYKDGGTSIKITDAIFIGNQSTNDGGGFYNYSEAFLNRVQFKGNSATTGGALYSRMPTVIVNGLFSGNKATINGGAIWQQQGVPVLVNVSISGNSATEGGALFSSQMGAGSIQNSIIHGNSSGLNANALSAQVAISNSLVQDLSSTENNNINGNVDPLFVNAPEHTSAPFTNGDYHLQKSSPVIDKGNNEAFDVGGNPDLSFITTDVEGLARIYNNIIDLGAYEDQPTLPITFVNFRAALKGNSIEIKWETTDEINISHFEIERSQNGINFTTLGKVVASGKEIYTYNDNSITVSGKYHYRIKIFEKDGSNYFSSITSFNFNQNENWVKTYPNPANRFITIVNGDNRPLNLRSRITSIEGKTVLQSIRNPIDVSKLPNGYYMLHLSWEENGQTLTSTKKIIIQRL